MSDDDNDSKRNDVTRLHFEAAHDLYERFTVYIATRTDGAVLPGSIHNASGIAHVNFEPGNMRNNQSLLIDEKGFSCLLAFDGAPFHVFLPWLAVLAIGTTDYSTTFDRSCGRAGLGPSSVEGGSGASPPSPGLRLVK